MNLRVVFTIYEQTTSRRASIFLMSHHLSVLLGKGESLQTDTNIYGCLQSRNSFNRTLLARNLSIGLSKESNWIMSSAEAHKNQIVAICIRKKGRSPCS